MEERLRRSCLPDASVATKTAVDLDLPPVIVGVIDPSTSGATRVAAFHNFPLQSFWPIQAIGGTSASLAGRSKADRRKTTHLCRELLLPECPLQGRRPRRLNDRPGREAVGTVGRCTSGSEIT
jgi:hypothetical protein